MIKSFEHKYTYGKINISKMVHKHNKLSGIGFNFSCATEFPKTWPCPTQMHEDKLKIAIFNCREAIEVKQALEEIVAELNEAIKCYNEEVSKEQNPVLLDELLDI